MTEINSVNSKQLANHLNITERRVQQLAKNGDIPIIPGNGNTYKFNLSEAIIAYQKLTEDREDETNTKERIDLLKAEKLEIEVMKLKKEIVRIDTVSTVWATTINHTAKYQREIPSRIATQIRVLVSEGNSNAIIRLFQDEITKSHEILCSDDTLNEIFDEIADSQQEASDE